MKAGSLDVLLEIDEGVKPAVYAQLHEATDWVNLNYWLELVLSAGIATFGLVLNSPAVVIGAMVRMDVAPVLRGSPLAAVVLDRH